MHDKPIGAGEDRAGTTAEQDAREEGRVLREVLAIYPGSMTLDELIRELTIDSTEFPEQDGIRRAVRDLIGGGLIHRVGDLVLPTRAAVNFHSLDQDR